ncbi:MAG: hypothetical protein C5B49_11200 [Bdellovibrio sp.]|nr:MAG: hypothetical protein C5B49_11200 [Bdellovibrio sp.]
MDLGFDGRIGALMTVKSQTWAGLMTRFVGARFLPSVILVILLSSCKSNQGNSSNFVVAMDSSFYVLIDAPDSSCVSRHSATTPSADLGALSTDIGAFSVDWIAPSPTAKLKIVYMNIYLNGQGSLSTSAIQVAGSELNCVLMNDVNTPPVFTSANFTLTTGGTSTHTPYTAKNTLIIGGLSPVDSTKQQSFQNRASVILYGVVHDPPNQDMPVTARTSFQYRFDGIPRN